MKDLLVPARTIRTDTSDKRREVLRCRFGGFGWCQRLKRGFDVLDVVLDPIQPCPIIVRESDTSPGGLHERLGGAGWPSQRVRSRRVVGTGTGSGFGSAARTTSLGRSSTGSSTPTTAGAASVNSASSPRSGVSRTGRRGANPLGARRGANPLGASMTIRISFIVRRLP
jgi:hypothetical protein